MNTFFSIKKIEIIILLDKFIKLRYINYSKSVNYIIDTNFWTIKTCKSKKKNKTISKKIVHL
jgi:hypothetical protein